MSTRQPQAATRPEVDDARQAVAVLLGAAGIHPPERELDTLARLYPQIRAQVDRLYAAEVGDDPPAGVLRAGDVWGPQP